MSEPSKGPHEAVGYLICGAIVGAIVGYGVYSWREFELRSKNAGWTVENRAPWCAVDDARKILACRYFSEKHCGIGAIMDEVRGPVGPLCVPRPK